MKMMRWLGWVVFSGWTMLAQAETYEDLTYSIVDGVITITECSYGAFGALSVPSSIDGIPVTTIGDNAFSACFDLTSVTIPDSVTSIGDLAFYYCSRLTAIHVDAGNAAYSSLDGVLFDKLQTTLVAYPEGGSNQYTIPDSVTSIGDAAFYICSGLTSVMIPDSVTSIGNYAFAGCSGLTSVSFKGNAPAFGGYVFGGLSDECVLYFYEGATGFTTPTFSGLSSVQLEGDSDLMPDSWEQQILEASDGSFTTVFQVKPDDDFDGDGLRNYQEYIAQTDPTDPASCFVLSLGEGEQTGSVSWYACSNRYYTIWTTDDLVDGTWAPFLSYTNMPGISGVMHRELTDAATSVTYYKLSISFKC